MLNRLRQRTAEEGGFTLIELLVVILIIGILAAIAIPAFLSQKGKANDAAAKTQVGTLQTAMETYSTENSGSYEGAELKKLKAIEPTLEDESAAVPTVVSAKGSEEYAIASEAKATKDKFTITNNKGKIERTCSGAGGGCSAAKTW